ncbi:Chitinase A1 precursor [compost metagenome]
MGTADFHVAMVDLLLTGFPVAKNPNSFFPALRPDQVLLGLPANVNAGGGFTSVAEVQKALDALIKGVQLSSYKTRGSANGYPDLRGVMTWSINWDKFNNFEFSNSYRAYLDGLSPSVPDTQAPTAPTNVSAASISSTSVNLSWLASTDNVGVTGYTVYYGSQSVNVTGTSAAITGLTPDTSYIFTVKASDAKGNQSEVSAPLTVRTTPATGGDQTAPSAPGNVQVTAKTATSISMSWTASTDNVGVTGYTITYGTNTVHVTGTTATINGLTANTLYQFIVTAKDAAGNVSSGSIVSVTTDVQGGAQAWAPNVSYKLNEEVTYGGKTYICRQPHTSLLGWEPSNVPALWLEK